MVMGAYGGVSSHYDGQKVDIKGGTRDQLQPSEEAKPCLLKVPLPLQMASLAGDLSLWGTFHRQAVTKETTE